MEKLTIKELAPYLPYDLKIQWSNPEAENSKMTPRLMEVLINQNFDPIIHKPLLRSLSQLTEEIEHNGVRFVPLEWLEKNMDFKEWNPPVMNDCTINMGQWHEYQKLFEWHFDVFGFIDKGLATEKK